MKALFVSHSAGGGGAEISMVTLIKEMRRMGNNVEVVLPRRGIIEKTLVHTKVPYKVMLSCANYIPLRGKTLWLVLACREVVNFAAVLRLYIYIKRHSYEIVVSNSTATDVGARAAMLAGVPHTYYVREFMEEDHGSTYTNQHRMRKLLEKSQRIIFISNSIADKYLSKYRINDYRVIYNGVEISDYQIENHIILERDVMEIIQVGAISEGKCSMESVRVIKRIKDKVRCHLTLMGNGYKGYIDEIKQYISENQLQEYVSIMPYDSNVKKHLAESDILLMNSRMEGFGRVTVEGMLGGLLAVGRNTAGTKEIIYDNSVGCLFSDEDELCSILQDIDMKREKYREIARRGYLSAIERFSPEVCAKNVLEYVSGYNVY